MPFRRLRLVCLAVAAAVAIGLLLHHGSAATQGSFISWGTASSAAPAPAPGPVSVVPPSPTPTPGSAGIFGTLRIPLGGLFDQLNRDTANTARGQLSLLQTLEDALRQRLEQLLSWLTGSR